jgi:hypothetical protein
MRYAGGSVQLQNSIIANNKSEILAQISGITPEPIRCEQCTFVSKDEESLSFSTESGDRATLTNCVFWGNPQVFESSSQVNVLYSNSSQSIEGPGNISEDPLFVDAEEGDFRLMPDSPCIDSGTDVGVYFDITGSTRPIDVKGRGQDNTGSEFDMGAYELQIPKADLNGDGKINSQDLLEFQTDWHNN